MTNSKINYEEEKGQEGKAEYKFFLKGCIECHTMVLL